MSFYMQAGNQPTKIRCDCAERFGVTINSYKQFEELKAFFEGQAEKGIFRDIPVQQPYYIGKGASHEIKWYANKWYKCCHCGTLWEFKYPNFPAAGAVRKFVDGQYPGPETDAYEEHLKDKALDTKLRFDVKYIEHNDKPDDFVYIFDEPYSLLTTFLHSDVTPLEDSIKRAFDTVISGASDYEEIAGNVCYAKIGAGMTQLTTRAADGSIQNQCQVSTSILRQLIEDWCDEVHKNTRH